MATAFKPCSVVGCNANAHSSAGGRRGLCQPHANRLRKLGAVDGKYPSEMEQQCSISGCDGRHFAKGFCKSHYRRWRKHGDPRGGRHRMPTGGKCGVAGCGEPARSKGYCEDHYARLLAHGDPTGGAMARGTIERWLREHVGFSGEDCLTWPFGNSTHGHGVATINGRYMTASRAMCILAHGEPPLASMHAAHSCGNGHLGCVNPRHLSWKTAEENAADKIAHGTDPRTVAKWRRARSVRQ